jgi:DnaJ-class molecular chaperone
MEIFCIDKEKKMNTVHHDVCPTCNGDKIIPGICECDSEWRGTEGENEWNDYQCTPDVICPTCSGTGAAQIED